MARHISGSRSIQWASLLVITYYDDAIAASREGLHQSFHLVGIGVRLQVVTRTDIPVICHIPSR